MSFMSGVIQRSISRIKQHVWFNCVTRKGGPARTNGSGIHRFTSVMSSPALQKAAPAVLSQGSVGRMQQFVNQQVWDNHKIHCHPAFISARLHRTPEYPGRPCRAGAKENCCERRAICSPVVFTLRLLSDQTALMSSNNQELMWVHLRRSFLINHILFHFYQAFFKYTFLNRSASDCDVNRFYNYSVHTQFTTISVSCAKLLHHFSF